MVALEDGGDMKKHKTWIFVHKIIIFLTRLGNWSVDVTGLNGTEALISSLRWELLSESV